MKAIKIEIKKEQINVNQPIYKEVLSPSCLVANVGDSLKQTNVTVNEKIYKMKKVYRGFNDDQIIYFVEENDEGIFNDLIQVSNDDIKKQYNNGVDYGKLFVLERFKNYLYNPWYKKIFRKKILKDIKKEIYRINNNF